MLPFHKIWNSETILGLLADPAMAAQAETLAQPENWKDLQGNGIRLQGVLVQDPKTLTSREISIELPLVEYTPDSVHCFCSDQKPCSHAVALLLLYLRNRTLFNPVVVPSENKKTPVVRYASQLPPRDPSSDVRRGIRQLDQWLVNLIRQGLGEVHVRHFPFWDEMANRMLAARMPALSQWLRETAVIAVRGGDWVESVLAEVSLMYLLTQSFNRFDQLSDLARADLREAVGWWLTPEEITVPPVRDQWLVIGLRRRVLLNKTPEQLVWLYGLNSQRKALIHSIGASEVFNNNGFRVSQLVDAEITFLPSRSPLKARLNQFFGESAGIPIQGTRIENAVREQGEALASNPWLRHYPVLIDEVYPSRFGKTWIVQHADGTFLPIAPHFQHKWILHAQAGGEPIQVRGIWDGRYLFPISTYKDGRTINLHSVLRYRKGQKAPDAFLQSSSGTAANAIP